MDAKVIAPQCLEKNVAYVPGGSFFPNGGKENHFRLNYSCMPEDKIVEGITKIARGSESKPEIIKSKSGFRLRKPPFRRAFLCRN